MSHIRRAHRWLPRLIAWSVAVTLSATLASAQIVQTATFENLTPGFYGRNFTDPLTGIHFRNLQTLGGQFVINGNGPSFMFAGTHYLTSDAFGFGGLGTGVSFTADLPHPASSVSLDVLDSPNPGGFLLQGFDTHGVKIAETMQAPGIGNFTIAISTPGYEIATFRTVVNDLRGTAYDNITFTIPKPAGLFTVFTACALLSLRRR